MAQKLGSSPLDQAAPAASTNELTPILLHSMAERSGNASTREARSAVELLLERIPGGLFGCDAEGKITFYNQHAANLWGHAPRMNVDDETLGGFHRAYSAEGTLLDAGDWPVARALREGISDTESVTHLERADGTRW